VKRCITPAIIAVVVLAIQSAAHSAASADQGPFEPTSESLMHYQVPQWYDDAKFGIYFHWAPFSVRA
jgi:alpha-L-fucosidase